MDLLFGLQDQLALVVDTHTQTRDGGVANLQSYDAAGQHVVAICFRECEPRLRRQLVDP